MSTRSLIGYQAETDKILGAYCHYDGYPEHVGKILQQHHKSYDSMLSLLKRGQIRNFDYDGQYACFGDDCSAEQYASVEEALNGCFDYVYLFDEFNQEWACFTKERIPFPIIKEVNIPQ